MNTALTHCPRCSGLMNPAWASCAVCGVSVEQPQEPITIEPAENVNPVYWLSGNQILGPAKVLHVAKVGDSEFWLCVELLNSWRWINSSLLRSKEAFERQGDVGNFDVSNLAEQIEDLRREMETLKAEMRLLRGGPVRPDGESLETLLEYIHDHCGRKPWTVASLFESAASNPLLIGSIRRCLAGRLSIYKLSVLLGRSIGPHGQYRLICPHTHTRDGRLFAVIGAITPITRKRE